MQERVKRKTNITVEIDTALASEAEAKGIDLKSFVEQALQTRLRAGGASGLTAEERSDLEWSQRYIEEHGPWWDDTEKS